MYLPKEKNEASMYLELVFMLCSRHQVKMNELLNIADNDFRLRMLIAELKGIEENIVEYKKNKQKNDD